MLDVSFPMKVIDISIRMQKDTLKKQEGGTDADIIEIGICSGCMKRSRIQDYCCEKCRGTFGQKSGILFKRIKEDGEFAGKFYNALMDNKKRSFIRLFFLPPGCREPGETPILDSRPRFRVVSSMSKQNHQDPDS